METYIMDTRSQFFVLTTTQLELDYDENIVVSGDELEDAFFDALDEQRKYGRRSFSEKVNYETLSLCFSSDLKYPTYTELLNAVVRKCVSEDTPLPTLTNAMLPTLATAVMAA